MAKVVTLTLNPTVDKSTSVEKLIAEHKLQCAVPKYEPGGGGINVSRALRRLGSDSLAIFPVGGRTGELLQQLVTKEEVQCRIVETNNETRENFIVVESSTNQQFRFGMPGTEIHKGEAQEFIGLLKGISPEYLIVSGSLPPGIEPEFLVRIADLAKEKGSKLILDTSGEALKMAAEVGVYMLKPNLGELSRLVGVESLNSHDVEKAALQIIESGKSEIVVVSMGPKGAILVTNELVERIPAPPVKKLSTVGAGDSMVAGMVHALLLGKDYRQVVQWGVACGTAATMNPGTELFKAEDVQKLLEWLQK